MTGRLPLIPTILVAFAVATMVALGFWQIERAGEKRQLLDRYEAAKTAPPVAFPTIPLADESLPLFRRATGYCLQPLDRRAVAGANRAGESGYAHLVTCRTGAEGPGMTVELGWSRDPAQAFEWTGGEVVGVIAPDRRDRIRLVSLQSPPGLQPAALPSSDRIPNNHLAYAVQWFLFAAAAVIIYLLAVRKKWLASGRPTP